MGVQEESSLSFLKLQKGIGVVVGSGWSRVAHVCPRDAAGRDSHISCLRNEKTVNSIELSGAVCSLLLGIHGSCRLSVRSAGASHFYLIPSRDFIKVVVFLKG